MTVLSAQAIERRRDMIQPFFARTRYGGLTFGLGPCGYDIRAEFDSHGEQREVLLRKGSFILASTVEKFRMPRDLVGIVHDKSTWARKGIAVQNTVIEPGWEGYLTLEISNHGNENVSLYAGVPIAQVLFHMLDEATFCPYDGKYQNQARGPQDSR